MTTETWTLTERGHPLVLVSGPAGVAAVLLYVYSYAGDPIIGAGSRFRVYFPHSAAGRVRDQIVLNFGKFNVAQRYPAARETEERWRETCAQNALDAARELAAGKTEP